MVSKIGDKDETDKLGVPSKTYGKREIEDPKQHGPLKDDVVAWDDPCARYKALADAYLALLTGGSESSIKTRTLDTEEEVKFNKSEITILKREMDKAKSECEAANGIGGLPNRFAIGGVFKPRCCGPRRP